MNAAEMSGEGLAIQFDPEEALDTAIVVSDPATDALRKRIAAAGPLRVRLGSEDDTSGNALTISGDAVTVQVYLDDDDTEGHAMTLRFPSAQDAAEFRRKVLLTGALAATIAVGATAINVGALAPSIATPAGRRRRPRSTATSSRASAPRRA